VLTGSEVQIYVDGKLTASVEAPGLIASDPQEAMEVGADEGSTVADYTGSFSLTGLIDEVRIYHQARNAAQIREHAKAIRPMVQSGMVLYYCFDRGDALDESGNRNNGRIDGAVASEGRFGQAIKFTGSAGSVAGFAVKHNWTTDVPVIARAMVLAGGTLFIAGPPDLVDEPEAFRRIGEPQVQRDLAEQQVALDGGKGTLLMAVSAADGTELAHYESGRLYMATTGGEVLCFGPDR
jgi:hypothetical protein